MSFYDKDIVDITKKISKEPRPHVLLLNGDLGAGKTTFVQEFVSTLSEFPVNVQSPTFLKLLSYKIEKPKRLNVLHMDAYRIDDTSDFERMSLDSYGDIDFFFIEWPEKFLDYLLEFGHTKSVLGIDKMLSIDFSLKENTRTLKYSWV